MVNTYPYSHIKSQNSSIVQFSFKPIYHNETLKINNNAAKSMNYPTLKWMDLAYYKNYI